MRFRDKIDIADINMIYFSSYRMKVHRPMPIVLCYLLFLAYCIRNFLRFEFRYTRSRKVLFVVPTLNNKRTLEPIYSKLDEADYTCIQGSWLGLPRTRLAWYSLVRLPEFHRMYRSLNADDKRLVRHFYLRFMTTYGVYHTCHGLLRRNPDLKMIVMANDHISVCRILRMLAPQYGVETLYTQHASVTERFPALQFTYSFLDGAESYEKYAAIGNVKGKVYLSGSPRFDALGKLRTAHADTRRIGIACNSIDRLQRVAELASYLIAHTDYEVVVRPHPEMMKTFPQALFADARISISRPDSETPFEFISRLKVLIANESSIHLDSLLVGIPTILYNFTDSATIDWYGYLRNGLMPKCDSKERIVQYIDKAALSATKAKYFYAAYGTAYEYNVGTLIARFIQGRIAQQSNVLDPIFVDQGAYHDYKSQKPCD